MNQNLIRLWSSVFSASMLMVLGCASSATGSESIVAMETEAENAAQVRSELTLAETSAPKQAAAAQERAPHEDEAQRLSSGPASLTVTGLTILRGGVYGSASDPYWTLDTGSGTRSWTKYVDFASGAFSSPPAVSVSISMFNMNPNTSRSYLRVTAEDVSISGFTLRFTAESSTAVPSLVDSATASWIAFGPN